MLFYLRIIFGVIRNCNYWPQLLANRTLTRLGLKFLAPQVKTIKLRNGTKFTMGSSQTIEGADLSLITEIWDRKSYYLKSKPEFKIHKNDTIFDIGANRGYFTTFASIEAPKGRVFSFEPSPDNFKILSTNLKLNSILNVKIEPMAVSSSKKEIELYLVSGNGADNSMYNITDKKINVPAIDLWSYCIEKKISQIDFLKMDCEGEEYEIFETAPKSFWKIVDKISMEYHEIDDHKPNELIKILEDNNFKILVFDSKYIKAIKI